MAKKEECYNSDLTVPKNISRIMLLTLLSTTLRIFVPTTTLFLIGLAIDLNASTKPWCMLIGTSVGIIISIVLINAQLKDIHKSSLSPTTEEEK